MDTAVLKLMEALSTIAPAIWNIVVRQAVIEGTADMVWGIFLVLACAILVYVRKRKIEYHNTLDYVMPEQEFIVHLLIFLAIICALAGLIEITTGIKWLAHPEFYALRYLINSVSGQ